MSYVFIGCFTSILIMHSVRLSHVVSRVDLLASENRSMACVILPHTPLLELDQGQVIGSTLEWQSLVDSLSYRYCLLLSLFI